MRQQAVLTDFDPARGVSVATLAHEYPAGFQVPEHAHGSDQLIFATSGVMEVSSAQNTWLIPPHFALWIPALTPHRISMSGEVSMRTLYFRRGLIERSAPGCAVLHVLPLLKELIVEAVRIGKLRNRNVHERALCELTALHVKNASPIPTFVTLPKEPRALSLARAVLDHPGTSMSLASLCAAAGASVRTIQRTFRSEVGMNFDAWRRQVRLTKAINLLLAGRSVKEAAFEVGYRQPSAFVECFRQTFGSTPKVWARSLQKLDRKATPAPTPPKPPR